LELGPGFSQANAPCASRVGVAGRFQDTTRLSLSKLELISKLPFASEHLLERSATQENDGDQRNDGKSLNNENDLNSPGNSHCNVGLGFC
jgi:hypothetical protein